jgi:hypothetical protein
MPSLDSCTAKKSMVPVGGATLKLMKRRSCLACLGINFQSTRAASYPDSRETGRARMAELFVASGGQDTPTEAVEGYVA